MFYSVLKVVFPCYTIRETKKPNVQYNAQYKTIYTCINYNTLGGSSDLRWLEFLHYANLRWCVNVYMYMYIT